MSEEEGERAILERSNAFAGKTPLWSFAATAARAAEADSYRWPAEDPPEVDLGAYFDSKDVPMALRPGVCRAYASYCVRVNKATLHRKRPAPDSDDEVEQD